MHVALVTPGFAPTPGGVETAVTALARGLTRAGCRVQVWTATRDAPDDEVLDGVHVRRHRARGPARYPVAAGLWRRTTRGAHDVDVVHAHGYHSTAALGVLTGRSPYVLTPHFHGGGHTAVARALHVAYAPVGRRLLGRAARVLAVSDAERRLLAASVPAVAGRTSVVPHGVDADRLARAAPHATDRPVVLVLGRLEPYKRVDEVITAFGRTRAPGRLVVVGDGPDRHRLAAVVADSPRRDDVELCGRLDDDDVARWLRTASVVVSRSEHEAFGLVALEGASAGAQVLLSDLPAHREVAGMCAGRARVVPGGADALRAALEAALAAPRREPCALRTWDDVAADHVRVYEQVLSAQRTATSS